MRGACPIGRVSGLAGWAIALAVVATPVAAQEQQAGNAASTNAEETFRQLIEQCDDIGVLTLRARVRLIISRATEAAASEAQSLLDEGLAKCGEGDIDAAKTSIERSIEVAQAGVSERFEADDQAEADADADDATEPQTDGSATEAESGEKPWWQFW